MSETKFTPGPWSACQDGDCPCSTIMSTDYPIATYTRGPWGESYPAIRITEDGLHGQNAEAYMERMDYGTVDEETAKANAHLISSSPDLYAELENLLAIVRGSAPEHDIAIQRALAALAKARGETP